MTTHVTLLNEDPLDKTQRIRLEALRLSVDSYPGEAHDPDVLLRAETFRKYISTGLIDGR